MLTQNLAKKISFGLQNVVKKFLSTPASNSGALSGIRIIDFSRVLAGPYCTSLLGDMGAEVIKIEAPGKGDDTRSWGPPFNNGESAYFISCNKNKMSIAVDMKVPESKQVIERLIKSSDVLIENFITGKAESLGISYEECAVLNPRIVYCSVSGFGSTGVYAHKPGYDGIISAMYGMQHITGPAGGEPVKPGVALTDVLTGLLAHGAILAALHERSRSGLGQKVETSLMEAQLSALVNVASNYLTTGEDNSRRWGTAHPSIVPYQTFSCAQGGGMFIAIGNDSQFVSLCTALVSSGIMTDEEQALLIENSYSFLNDKNAAIPVEKFRNNKSRVRHREELVPLLEVVFSRRDTNFWNSALSSENFPFGPVRSIKEAFECPQARARDMVEYVDHPKCGKLAVVGSPVKFSRTPCSIRLPPPLLGEHTYSVLKDILNFTDEEIDKLVACGSISEADAE